MEYIEHLQNLKFTSEYWVMLLPSVLMIIDIITGYYNAWRKKKVSSAKMRDGLGKKMAELSFIFVAMLFSWAFGIDEIVDGVSLYVIFMELISIIENWEKLDLPLPKKLKDIINNNHKGDE